MNIGTAIRTLRKKRFPGLTARAFTATIPMHQTTYSKIEKGHIVPEIKPLERIAQKLGVPVFAILMLAIEESDVVKGREGIVPDIHALANEVIDGLESL